MADGDKGSKFSTLDTVLTVGAVVAGIFLVLWLVSAVVGVALFVFKVVVLVIVVAILVRVVHFFTRHGD